MNLNKRLGQIADWIARKQWSGSGSTFTWNAELKKGGVLVCTHPSGLVLKIRNLSLVSCAEGVEDGIRRRFYQGDCEWKSNDKSKTANVILRSPASREPLVAALSAILQDDTHRLLSYLEQVAVALFGDELIGKRQPEPAKTPWHVT